MTLQYNQTLIVTRVAVYKGTNVAYDEIYHAGVNIIRGENSSGKSTILNFIYYGLGGDLADWSESALLCDRVYVSVLLSGKPVVLSRLISRAIGQPMEIFGGSYEEALTTGRSSWARYPYRRSESIESFSQAIFRLLGLPEVANDVSGNITMHQILRLLYADQLSPVESLFRFERFDQPVLRDAIGRVLCGADDTEIYANELRLKSLDRELSGVIAEMQSLLTILSGEKHSLTLEWVAAERSALDRRRKDIEESIERLEASSDVLELQEPSLSAQQSAYARVKALQLELSSMTKDRDSLQFTIADSQRFIADMEIRLTSLSDANLIASELRSVKFEFCPVCYAPIDKDDGQHSHEDACYLCKTPFLTQRGQDRISSMMNELGRQIKQSQALQVSRSQELKKANVRLAEIVNQWRDAARELRAVGVRPSSEARANLDGLQRQLGYFQRESEDLDRKERYITLVDQLSARREGLSIDIERLKLRTDGLKASQQRVLSRSYTEVADEVRGLLKLDLPRQDSFLEPKSINFDFYTNKITVDGHSYFSASSRVILKSSFFVGFLLAASKDPAFRHPRFCMLDTIEDKGMEQARSHNFQEAILAASLALPAAHQIIFATAMISPKLDNPRYTVGGVSSLSAPTLRLS